MGQLFRRGSVKCWWWCWSRLRNSWTRCYPACFQIGLSLYQQCCRIRSTHVRVHFSPWHGCQSYWGLWRCSVDSESSDWQLCCQETSVFSLSCKSSELVTAIWRFHNSSYSSNIKLFYFFWRNMNISNWPKDSKMTDLWFSSTPSFIRSPFLHRFRWTSIEKVNSCSDCFCPEHVWKPFSF